MSKKTHFYSAFFDIFYDNTEEGKLLFTFELTEKLLHFYQSLIQSTECDGVNEKTKEHLTKGCDCMKKKMVIVVVCILVLWVTVGCVDYSRVNSFERPIFCICKEPMQDGGSGKYVGLGYSFDIEGNFMPEDENPGVTKWTYRLFGIELQTQIRD